MVLSAQTDKNIRVGTGLRGIKYKAALGMALAVALSVLPATAHAQANDKIAAIAVEGAARVEAETVRSYLLVREGDSFDPLRIDRSLKSLFSTGLFADVSLKREGNTLVVSVIENPVINRIAFEGNNRIDDEELAA